MVRPIGEEECSWIIWRVRSLRKPVSLQSFRSSWILRLCLVQDRPPWHAQPPLSLQWSAIQTTPSLSPKDTHMPHHCHLPRDSPSLQYASLHHSVLHVSYHTGWNVLQLFHIPWSNHQTHAHEFHVDHFCATLWQSIRPVLVGWLITGWRIQHPWHRN